MTSMNDVMNEVFGYGFVILSWVICALFYMYMTIFTTTFNLHVIVIGRAVVLCGLGVKWIVIMNK